MLTGTYNEKCDIWSVGIILYILFVGNPPFEGKDDKEIIRLVKKAEVNFAGPEWKRFSRDGIDFVKKLLAPDPDLRLSAEEALQHIWLRRYGKEQVDSRLVAQTLIQLRNFKANGKLQLAAITFISS